MKNSRASVLISGSAAVCMLTSIAARGQEKPEDATTLEEITVTAQFVRQNLQETPVAITAISSAMLESRGQQSIQEIARQAPNVTLTTGGAFGGPSLVGFIRGVGQTDFDPALEPGVGLYVDDVYYSTLTGSVLDLLDLDRVEVLRGPQGTLAGKNSIGGSIKLYSRAPSAENDGYVEAGYGSFNATSVRAASNFTMIPDKLFVRVAGVSRSQDGYITRLDYGCTHPGTALAAQLPSNLQGPSCVIGTEGGVKYTSGRVALHWLPSDKFTLDFSADVLNEVSEAPANVLLGVGPTRAPVIVNGVIWPSATPVPPTVSGCEFIAYGPLSCDPQSPNDPYVNYATYTDPRSGLTITPNQTVKSRGMSLNLNWKLSDALNLQSITAYRRYVSGFGDDQSASPIPLAMLYQTMTHNQTSQELRLNGKAGTRLDYTLGAFYIDEYTGHDARVDLGYVGFDFIHGPDPVDAKTSAVFAHGILHVTDRFDVSLGVRYNEDEKDYTYLRKNPDGSAIQPCIGPPGTPGNPPNCLIASLNGVSSRFEGTRTDYRAALSFRWTDNLMTYAQYSTGYKGGGVNPRPFYGVQAITFEPETLEAIEVGLKSQFFNDRLRVNAALFANEYNDIQLTLNDCTALFGPVNGVPCLAIANAGDADVKGGELEIDWVPVEGMQIDASFSYLDFEMTRISPDTGLDLNRVTPYTPENKWSVGAQYRIEMGGAGSITPRVDANYQSKLYTGVENTVLGRVEDYTLLNARIVWDSANEDWQAALECQNLTDELYYVSKNDGIASFSGMVYGAPGMPRTYQFSLKRSF
jgi:iron complex outermembrane recepter protein